MDLDLYGKMQKRDKKNFFFKLFNDIRTILLKKFKVRNLSYWDPDRILKEAIALCSKNSKSNTKENLDMHSEKKMKGVFCFIRKAKKMSGVAHSQIMPPNQQTILG